MLTFLCAGISIFGLLLGSVHGLEVATREALPSSPTYTQNRSSAVEVCAHNITPGEEPFQYYESIHLSLTKSGPTTLYEADLPTAIFILATLVVAFSTAHVGLELAVARPGASTNKTARKRKTRGSTVTPSDTAASSRLRLSEPNGSHSMPSAQKSIEGMFDPSRVTPRPWTPTLLPVRIALHVLRVIAHQVVGTQTQSRQTTSLAFTLDPQIADILASAPAAKRLSSAAPKEAPILAALIAPPSQAMQCVPSLLLDEDDWELEPRATLEDDDHGYLPDRELVLPPAAVKAETVNREVGRSIFVVEC